MNHEGNSSSGATPPLPTSIWVLAGASLLGQSLWLIQQGVRTDDAVSLGGSVVIGALVFGFVSAGVVRARTVRLVLAWVVLALVMVGDLVDVALADTLNRPGLVLLSLATSALALGGLATFHRTEWFAWQRTKPTADLGTPIRLVVAIGVLVGVLGGLIGQPGNEPEAPAGVEVHSPLPG